MTQVPILFLTANSTRTVVYRRGSDHSCFTCSFSHHGKKEGLSVGDGTPIKRHITIGLWRAEGNVYQQWVDLRTAREELPRVWVSIYLDGGCPSGFSSPTPIYKCVEARVGNYFPPSLYEYPSSIPHLPGWEWLRGVMGEALSCSVVVVGDGTKRDCKKGILSLRSGDYPCGGWRKGPSWPIPNLEPA